MQGYIENFIHTILIPAIGKIIIAAVVLIVGIFAIRWGIKRIKHLVYKSKMDASLKPFLVSLIDALL